MKINISDKHFLEIISQGYSLDIVFLLKLIEEGNDVEVLYRENEKIALMGQTMLRKGLVSTEGKITLVGQELINFINSRKRGNITKVKIANSGFENWWKAYPGTNVFEYKGRKFRGDRTLRVKKNECQAKYEKIILEGEYSDEDMLQSLEYEITMKKESSIKTNANKLTYMQNSLTYLNQRTFEPFIELIKEGNAIIPQESHTINGGTDI